MCLAPQFGAWGKKAGGTVSRIALITDRFRFSPGSCQDRERASNEPSRVANNCSLALVQRRSFALALFLISFISFSPNFWALLTFRSFTYLFRLCDSLFQRPAPNLKKGRSLVRSPLSTRLVLPAHPKINDCRHTPCLQPPTLPLALGTLIKSSTLVFPCHDHSLST